MVPHPFFIYNDADLLNRLQGGTTTTTTTTSGTTGQYPTGTGATTGQHGESFPSHHKHHIGGVSQDQEVTGKTVKPTMTDKIVGGVEKVTGKMTDNTGMYQKGAERAVSLEFLFFLPSVPSFVLNICFLFLNIKAGETMKKTSV